MVWVGKSLPVNFTPVPRHDYRLGVPNISNALARMPKQRQHRISAAAAGNAEALIPETVAAHGRAQSIALTPPPLSAIFLAPNTSKTSE